MSNALKLNSVLRMTLSRINDSTGSFTATREECSALYWLADNFPHDRTAPSVTPSNAVRIATPNRSKVPIGYHSLGLDGLLQVGQVFGRKEVLPIDVFPSADHSHVFGEKVTPDASFHGAR